MPVALLLPYLRLLHCYMVIYTTNELKRLKIENTMFCLFWIFENWTDQTHGSRTEPHTDRRKTEKRPYKKDRKSTKLKLRYQFLLYYKKTKNKTIMI